MTLKPMRVLPFQFGTPLTRIQNKIPICTFSLGMRVLMWKTFTDFFGTMKSSYILLASSCCLTIAAAAFIHDIPNIVWGAEQILTGSLSLFDSSVQWGIVHHIGMRYLRPLALNLGRGFFLVLIGTLLFTGMRTLLKQYGRVVSYNQSRQRAITHLQEMQQLIQSLESLLQSVDAQGKRVDTYLEEQLKIFNSGQEKEVHLSKICNTIGVESNGTFEKRVLAAKGAIKAKLPQTEELSSQESEAYTALEQRFCSQTEEQISAFAQSVQACLASTLSRMQSEKSSPKACQTELLKIEAYQKLWDIFCPDASSSERIPQYFSSVLKNGLSAGLDPAECLENLFLGFKDIQLNQNVYKLKVAESKLNPKAINNKEKQDRLEKEHLNRRLNQVIALDSKSNSAAPTILLLFKIFSERQEALYKEIQIMREVYDFNPPTINIELWQTPTA